jgi:hypothetical protein
VSVNDAAVKARQATSPVRLEHWDDKKSREPQPRRGS